MKQIISTWVYCPPPGKKYVHSQTGADSDTEQVQSLYWRCAGSLFASSARVHDADSTRHVLLANIDPPASVFGVDFHSFLKKHNVEVVKFSSVTCTPTDYYEAWNTQFIVLDALRELNDFVSEADVLFLLDSDCIFRNAITDADLRRAHDERALLYSINYGRDYVVNGLSPAQMAIIEKEIEGKDLRPDEPFLYHGGEFICLRGDQLALVEQVGRTLLNVCLRRHKAGLPKYNEEAHLLSHVYRRFGYPSNSANAIVKRMWTDRSITRNISGSEDSLAIWHLLSEKKIGFARYFDRVAKGDADFDLARLFRVSESQGDFAAGKVRQAAKRVVRLVRGARFSR